MHFAKHYINTLGETLQALRPKTPRSSMYNGLVKAFTAQGMTRADAAWNAKRVVDRALELRERAPKRMPAKMLPSKAKRTRRKAAAKKSAAKKTVSVEALRKRAKLNACGCKAKKKR